jgi:putative spermidine/putrescine transport system permease protein
VPSSNAQRESTPRASAPSSGAVTTSAAGRDHPPSGGLGEPSHGGRASLARRLKNRTTLLMLPVVVVLGVFFFYPLLATMVTSVNEPTWGLQNYRALLEDGVTVKVLVRTVLTAVLVAVSTLVIAYPYAFAMTRVSPRTRRMMTLVVLLPFWTSLMARTFAWYLLEQQNGVLQRFFAVLGFEDVILLGTLNGVAVAMVQVMLPFMVLPLYSGMARIDLRLLDAAQSLGASRLTAFRSVYLPLTVPAVVSGFTLVFIISLGFYVTPAILGSPRQALLSQVIATRVFDLLDFPGASAMGALLLVATLLVLLAVARIARPVAGAAEVARHD